MLASTKRIQKMETSLVFNIYFRRAKHVALRSLTSIHLLHLILITLLLNSALVNSSLCVHEKCDCKFITGRKFAFCNGLNLTSLPQCDTYSRDDIDFLHDIQAINLTQNNFPVLSAQFFHNACLDNLQKIFIQQVGLQNIDDRAFNPLKNLIELSLSSNSLTKIPSKSIENLTALRFLDLSYNNIQHLNNNSFKTLGNLRTLLLNNNQLDFIDIDCFNGLNKIEIIKLNSNRLVKLQPEIFINLKVLHSLYLEDNMWDCNCKMQPFKRMLLNKPAIKIHDEPKCLSDSHVWSNLALDSFQCTPTIFRNFSDSEVSVSEGTVLRLKCAIFIETFGDSTIDDDYLSHSQINWHWNNILITNNSKGCDDCKSSGNSANQKFEIQEYVRNYDSRLRIKISNLEVSSIMTVNEGNYICNASNKAGKDELIFRVHVIPYYTHNNNYIGDTKISPAASSDSQIFSYKTKDTPNDQSNDHILFGLVLGLICGLFIVLVIFSIILVAFFRKHKVAHQPHELVIVDASTDNNTVDENHETNTETTEKLNVSQTEFNPLLVVNPVQKPPRLGIPDVSSIYSHPSWTIDRANIINRSRYASYAETEPIYSDYYTLLRPNRHVSRLDNRNATFISDTASEV